VVKAKTCMGSYIYKFKSRAGGRREGHPRCKRETTRAQQKFAAVQERFTNPFLMA
jgi:hypothetical protein